ncbi:hypothetical protein N7452_011063 [Penicillium brevicompactum]|uniref:Lipid droplet-associated hydrolase n=1 Tax=Penicillium brevicompactum TaxID=5074 RepID=A0A9W9U8R0_PENBR|nr:hypothetical protein N7452_011063 [Penicillium brevicompactum]
MPDPMSQITPNTFSTTTGHSPRTTIFFISGNPGLISYYHPFLSLLAKYLTNETSFRIHGSSLGGFEIGQESPKDLDLEDQIQFVQGNLKTLMNNGSTASKSDDVQSNDNARQKVILIGHSVGAYMAMEILNRHRDQSFDIIGGIMLFPTLMDIAASPSGQKLSTLLSIIPRLALVVSLFARLLTFILPVSVLRAVVRVVMNDPPSHALDTTCSFLRSRGGVRQALHMAADEMRTITSDKWGDDIWGAHEPVAKLFFYFGRNDHWVAEKTRDEIVKRGEKGGPTMVVCEEGLPHAFCLKHSDTMAKKVATMVGEIVGVQ